MIQNNFENSRGFLFVAGLTGRSEFGKTGAGSSFALCEIYGTRGTDMAKNRKRVLWIMRDTEFALALSSEFQGLTVTFMDGDSASRRAARCNEFDFCVMDADLPEGQILELLKRLRGRQPKLYVLVYAQHLSAVSRLTEQGANAGYLRGDRNLKLFLEALLN